MIKIKNAELEIENISITIPENFRADIDDDHPCITCGENIFSVRHETEDYYVIFEISFDWADPIEAIISNAVEPKPTVKEFKRGGLSGYKAAYRSTVIDVYEERFILEETDEESVQLSILIAAEKGEIEKIMETEDFKKLLNGIRSTKE